MKMTVGIGEQNDESLWEVSRVSEETPAPVVAEVLGKQLVAVIEKTVDVMNMWLKEEIYKMVASDALIIKPLSRKAISQKLKEGNQEMKNGKRYLKYWGQAKMTGFIFDVVGTKEVERLVKNEIKWGER